MVFYLIVNCLGCVEDWIIYGLMCNLINCRIKVFYIIVELFIFFVGRLMCV